MSRKNRQEAKPAHKWAIVLIVALSLLAHGCGVRNGFVNFDDDLLVLQNADIQSLSPGHVVGLFKPRSDTTYQPIRVLSYAIDYALWGHSPAGYHAINILLHTGAAVLLYFFIWTLLPRLCDVRNRMFTAACVAAFYACHTVHVESVAWVSSRKYGLLAVFAFSALWLYARERRAAAIPFFVLALMSSPFGIVLPGLFLLVDLTTRRWAKPPVYLALGLVTLALAICLKVALGGSDGPGLGAAHIRGAPHLTFLTMIAFLADYAYHLLLPIDLHPRYPNHLVPSIVHPKIAFVIFAVAAAVWWSVRCYRDGKKAPLFCLGFAAIAWAPVSGVIPTSTMMADRYLYLPSVGIFLAVALLLDHYRWTKAIRIGVAVYLALLTLLSIRQTTRWSDSITLWEDSLRRLPRNELALVSLGNALREAQRPDEAADKFRAALAISDQFADAHVHLGNYYGRRREFDDAIRHHTRATELAPAMAVAWSNLGACQLETKEFDTAVATLQHAISLDASNPDSYRNLGVALLHRNDIAGSAEAFQRCLTLSPNATLAGQVAESIGARDPEAAKPFYELQRQLQSGP
jgi:tetratricopeptide (TPR) repeat protein